MYEPITAEQLLATRAATPDLDDALRRLGEAFMELGRCIYNALVAAVRKIAETFRKWLDAIFQHMNPRSYHLYKHAKKARVRNKNRNRLLKELHRWLN